MFKRLEVSFAHVSQAFVALVIGSALMNAGCGRCAADCSSSIEAVGHVNVSVANNPELSILLCYGGDCYADTLKVDDNGALRCVDNVLGCSLTDETGGAQLSISVIGASDDFSEGEEVSVAVQDAKTGEVLVDAKPKIESVETSSICGTQCEGVELSW